MSHPLLTPRYIVIADYPGNTSDIGYVFESNIGDYYEKFPAVFRRLHWSEHREVSEMPEYVKEKEGEDVWRAFAWSRCRKIVGFECGLVDSTHFWLPATEEEYNQYLKSKKEKI